MVIGNEYLTSKKKKKLLYKRWCGIGVGNVKDYLHKMVVHEQCIGWLGRKEKVHIQLCNLVMGKESKI